MRVRVWRVPVAWSAALLILLLVGSEFSPNKLIDLCLVPACFLLTIGLGGLFLILLYHLLAARWLLRVAGYLRCNLELIPASLLFLVPIVLRFDETWRRLVPHQTAYQSGTLRRDVCHEPFVLAHLFICYTIWLGLAYLYARRSELGLPQRADRFSSIEPRTFSVPALLLLGFTLVPLSFGGVASLGQAWRSALAGAYVFSGALSAALAFVAVFMLALDRIRACDASPDLELRQGVSNLLFGFVSLWAYIALSQELLVCCPSAFCMSRSGPVWRWPTASLIILRFVLPFLALLSARSKRSAGALLFSSLCVLAGHWVDWSWLVLPALYPRGAQIDVTSLAVVVFTELAVGAVFLTGFVRELEVQGSARRDRGASPSRNGMVPSDIAPTGP